MSKASSRSTPAGNPISAALADALARKVTRMSPGDRKLYGVPQACTRLSIARTALYRLRERGVLEEPVRCGRRVLWSAEALDRAAARIVAGEAA